MSTQRSSIFTRFKLLLCAGLALVSQLFFVTPAFASESFGVAPTYQLITLVPGQTFEGNFEIVNPAGNQYDFDFELSIEPFTEDNNWQISATANGDYNRIVDWIELPYTEGSVAPNSSQEVRFYIHVPESAPAGGQYASIVIGSKPDETTQEGVSIHEVIQQNHLIYAEVSGTTVRKGNINYAKVPGFMFSGPIYGTSEITNEGNVHSPVTQILQVFPLFSKEEVWTNEEKPKVNWIMPGNTNLTRLAWSDTPKVGIFRVIYSVEYEGVEPTVEKFVIVCPAWLLALIVGTLVLIALAYVFGTKRKKRN